MKISRYKEYELNHLKNTTSMIEDKVFAERVEYYLKWYIYKARHAKGMYYFFNVISICLPLFVTYLNIILSSESNESLILQNLGTCNIRHMITILTLLISLSTSIMGLFRFLEKWHRCRKAVSDINLFLDRYLDYQGQSDFHKEKYNLHREFETIIKQENRDWEVHNNSRSEVEQSNRENS